MELGWVMGFSWVRVVKISTVKVVIGGLGGIGVGYGLFLGSGGQNKHSEGGFK